ncbi:MAG: hypothetical protein GF364_01415 [Candidatus Lokiarchaeota archaeon]|nr:hypothetical protein [Candidatus Lokiarchaeota archaeon]
MSDTEKKDESISEEVERGKLNQTKKKTVRTAKLKSKGRKTKASVTFYYIIAFSAIALAIGSLWAIMDAIQPEGKWEWFLNLGWGLKFVIVGALGFLFFLLLISAWILFRKGNKFIYKLLYPGIHKAKIKRENMPAKIITGGLLVSIFVIASGIIISLLQGVFSGGATSDFLVFFLALTNGLKTMLISLLVLSITLLIVIFVWIWENGYNFVLNKIIAYNRPEDGLTFTKKQNIVTTVVYVISMASLVALSFGTVWAIMDAFAPTGKWEAFLSYPFTWQFTIIGALASLLFLLLILGLLFYKRGRESIKRRIFKEFEFDDLKPTKADKFLTIGLMIFINVIIIGFAIWGLMELINLTGDEGDISISDFILSLPNGLLLILISGIVIGVTWAIVLGNRISKNNYHFYQKRIIKLRHKLSDESLEEEYDIEES